jgi:isoleucyl-tRNA synthetase
VNNPVGDDGRFLGNTPALSVGELAGTTVWEANPLVLQELDCRGRLLKTEKIQHSYPHCWRHKTPIIFRATTQWFIGMDTPAAAGLDGNGRTLRETAKKAIADTTFYPSWGKSRIEAMIAGRPDWTLSRQRNWGVPLPFFLDRETDELHPETERLIEEAAARVAKGGIEAWFAATCEDFGVDPAKYRKLTDTVDVWFDSGTTHFSVLRGLKGQKWPADLYLEGSDQHRGWFQSSLLTSCAMDGRAPYDALLTHGFVVDGQGRKMSKSLGNVIAPQKVSDTLGAEILRLWVASTDYSGELSLSDEILKRVVEAYRRIRNTLRFLLANLADFDPAKHALPAGELFEIDRYAIALAAQWQKGIEEDYARFEFHPAVAKLQTFCSEDLGAFYLDILKDRLYTTGADSRPRRSAQTALWHLTHSLLRVMAPILSFTAEEAWPLLAPQLWKSQGETIFTQTYYEFPAVPDAHLLLPKWSRVRELRAEVLRRLEEVRSAGGIGSSLQAEVELRVTGEDHDLLATLGDDLRFVLITSQARLAKAATPADAGVAVTPSPHAKCERCWHWRADVGANPAHPTICGRCDANLHGGGEPRRFA